MDIQEVSSYLISKLAELHKDQNASDHYNVGQIDLIKDLLQKMHPDAIEFDGIVYKPMVSGYIKPYEYQDYDPTVARLEFVLQKRLEQLRDEM